MGVSSPTIPLGTGIKVMTIVLQTNANFPAVTLLPISGNSSVTQNKLTQFFADLQRGSWNSNFQIIQGGVYATGTAVCAAVIDTNTLVIGGVTLTAVSSAPTSVQFVRSSTNSVTAANIVTTINALTTLNKVVQASSSSGTVTIVSLIPGTIGNLITLSAGGGTITVGTALTGGTDGTKGVISHGL